MFHSSSCTRLLRIIAFCLRFIKNCRTICRSTRVLTPYKLLDTEKIHVESVEEFPREIDLKSGTCINKKNRKFLTLTPFLDDGILRVGGRLSNFCLSFEFKHPIFYPAIIINHEQKRNFHTCSNKNTILVVVR